MVEEKKIRWPVFLPIAFILVITALIAVFWPSSYYELQTTIVDFAFNNFGWLFNFTVLALIFISLFLGFSKYGNIKFGGSEAKPSITKWQWFAISLTAGIGTGIVFWGLAEPLTFFSEPPEVLGIQPGTEEAAVFSMASSMVHWTLAPYSLYVMAGIAVAYACYNMKLPYTINSTLYPLLGDRAFGHLGTFVNILCIFGIAGGMAAVLGEGVLQIGSGIDYLTGITAGPFMWSVLVVLITVTYVISSYSGLQKGIRFLSDQNTKIYLCILAFIIVVGPTSFIFNLGSQSTGYFLSNVLERLTWTSPMEGSEWPREWPLFHWSIFLAYAPIIGMFLARLAYGRTLRQFVIFNLLLPAGFGMLWFWVFGGAAIFYDWQGGNQLWNLIQNEESGLEISLFVFLEHLPWTGLISLIMLFCIFISFTTIADSITTTVSALTTTGNTFKNPEPLAKVKIFWGSLLGLLALLTITAGTGGGEITAVDANKQMATVAGFSILFFIILQVISTLKSIIRQADYDKTNYPESAYNNHSYENKGVNKESYSNTTISNDYGEKR
ncbi:BCCT family transporter [Salicibibacter cibi]|uniref:BCCT family transporter n=1 Tax=Salicibibacter cibi TaxID=2743001 RepID=A0A7T6Z9N8_9BACI|nr:BCCT family transporter [Salicibibacter cibi]QQK79272.1 BCCT family transporter [Salicibibacter cibi]